MWAIDMRVMFIWRALNPLPRLFQLQESESGKQTEREKERQKETKREWEKKREIERVRERERKRERERETDRQRERERERERESEKFAKNYMFHSFQFKILCSSAARQYCRCYMRTLFLDANKIFSITNNKIRALTQVHCACTHLRIAVFSHIIAIAQNQCQWQPTLRTTKFACRFESKLYPLSRLFQLQESESGRDRERERERECVCAHWSRQFS